MMVMIRTTNVNNEVAAVNPGKKKEGKMLQQNELVAFDTKSHSMHRAEKIQ